MGAFKFLFTTDYGLISLIGSLIMFGGIGGFFLYLFLFKKDSPESRIPREKIDASKSLDD
jgi:hypothetical protein